jgi:hypothetical protein
MANRLGKPLMYTLCAILLGNGFFVGNTPARAHSNEISKESRKTIKSHKDISRAIKALERVARRSTRVKEKEAVKYAVEIQAKIARQIARQSVGEKYLANKYLANKVATKNLKEVVSTSIVVAEIVPKVTSLSTVSNIPTADVEPSVGVSKKGVIDAVNAVLSSYSRENSSNPYIQNNNKKYSLLYEVIGDEVFINKYISKYGNLVVDIFGQDGGGYVYASLSPAAGGSNSTIDMVRVDWGNIASGVIRNKDGAIELTNKIKLDN